MFPSSFALRARRIGFLVLLAGAVAIFASTVSTVSPHFYPDDPIAREPDSQDASKAQAYEIGSLFEMTTNLFVTAGYFRLPATTQCAGRRACEEPQYD